MPRQAGVRLRRIGVLSRDVGEPRIGSECGCECVCVVFVVGTVGATAFG